jgi:hypothetical protein
VTFDHLIPCVRSPREVPQHFGVGIELDFEIKMTICERNEQESLGVQDRLRHRGLEVHTRYKARVSTDIIGGVRVRRR